MAKATVSTDSAASVICGASGVPCSTTGLDFICLPHTFSPYYCLPPDQAYRCYQNGQQNQRLIEWLYCGQSDLAVLRRMLNAADHLA